MKVKDLPTPAFVINRHAFAKNCQEVLDYACRNNFKLRPHVKSHKTIEGAFLQATGKSFDPDVVSTSSDFNSVVSGFVTSTLPEVAMMVDAAEKYGGAPFNDILYGVPIVSSKLATLVTLKKKLSCLTGGGQIHVLVDHVDQVQQIEDFVKGDNTSTASKFTAFLKLDTGYHRAGVPCDGHGVKVATAIIESSALELVGVYSHCGQSYQESSELKKSAIAERDSDKIASFLELLEFKVKTSGLSCLVLDLIVSVGSTPSLSSHTNRHKLSHFEIHPGNYTLYDRQQIWTGACSDTANIAGRIVTKVIGQYEDRNTILLDAGALALSKDTTPQGGMGEITGFPNLDCFSLSQEVTQVRPKDPDEDICPYDDLPLGSTLTLLPNHSCLAAACFSQYYIIDDPECRFSPDQDIVEVWTPAKFFSVTL